MDWVSRLYFNLCDDHHYLYERMEVNEDRLQIIVKCERCGKETTAK